MSSDEGKRWAEVPKSEGYISSGVERTDSVGDPSNLRPAGAAVAQSCIPSIVMMICGVVVVCGVGSECLVRA